MRTLLPFFLLLVLCCFVQSSQAQCDGVSIFNTENFNTATSGSWTTYDTAGDDSWLFDNNEAAMNGFGGTTDEDWLISPAIDLSAAVNPIANFDYSDRFSGPDLVFRYSTDYVGSGNPASATWTTLLTLTDQSSNNSLPPYINASVDISSITATAVYFAFHYTTTGSGGGDAEDWRIDNICISADSGGAAPTCSDGIMNGNETGLDCGGPDCAACPTCNDGIMNGNETGVDCGGSDCQPCSVGAYYDGIETMIQNGSECANLKTALYNLIDGHTVIPYSSSSTYDVRMFMCDHDTRLNDANTTTIIWDVFSEDPNGPEAYEYVCGPLTTNTSQEGNGYNREHVFPKSWWGGSTSAPQHTDLNNLLPSDGHVNQQKSNHGLGETSSPTFTGSNGTKVGPPDNNCGGAALIFEPIDEYKGDFARMHLYMAVRYENIIAGWESNSANSMATLDGNSYTVYETCYRNMLLDWHENDPVSAKEIARNDAIFSIQGNRNPFVDHPEYAEYIWGDDTGTSCSDIAPRFIAPKVYLQGPFNSGIMTTDINSILPNIEPYTALGHTGLQNAGTNLSSSSATTNTGGDVIVDWVVVELRSGGSPSTATTVVAKCAALLQADGDVVDENGFGAVGFDNVPMGNYYVVIRHRNHLAIMSNLTYLVE